ncbi:HAMP domain-containing histidine kinase [Paenarthrobacter sp. DKR-5]|uniref:sensor histidine kinase n=1 Tax=Paenarthrobacter sp. DKR-5 TaxID=2835535 RepID=UPI001BDBCBC8|nr:HAMP domain-containing sensor histidine kinase [Paenarthrobacter sp. DKR-5]MBT1004181.1 HAMP domain-containing histidine kinase [Paenarthrobacter sp. DKR-5]
MLRAWKSASLRSQLVATIVILLVASLAAIGFATLTLLRSYLSDTINNQLVQQQRTILQTGTSQSEASGPAPVEFYVAYYDGSGRLVSENRHTADKPVLGTMDLENATARTGKPFDASSTDGGDDWRVAIAAPANVSVYRGGVVQSRFVGSVVVALPTEPMNRTLDQVGLIVFGGGFLTIVLATVAAYWTVTRAFRPLARVEKTAAAIAAGDLSRRVDVENPATEIGRLSGSLNAMLTHIEAAFAARTASEKRMRRFVADASHELRTPLVTIRGFSELYRHGALATPDDVGTAMGRIESEAKRMGELVEDLLMLARIDEQRPLQLQPVDLLLLSHDALVDTRASAPDRPIKVIGLDGGPGRNAPVSGDQAKLRQVVSNLVGNCLRYTPAGSPIEIAVGVEETDEGRQSVLEVRDHGPGIDEEEAPRVFERFYRADSSRTRDTGGSGLGLAIVSALVAAHGGTVRHSETAGGGATMTIRLPYLAHRN